MSGSLEAHLTTKQLISSLLPFIFHTWWGIQHPIYSNLDMTLPLKVHPWSPDFFPPFLQTFFPIHELRPIEKGKGSEIWYIMQKTKVGAQRWYFNSNSTKISWKFSSHNANSWTIQKKKKKVDYTKVILFLAKKSGILLIFDKIDFQDDFPDDDEKSIVIKILHFDDSKEDKMKNDSSQNVIYFIEWKR